MIEKGALFLAPVFVIAVALLLAIVVGSHTSHGRGINNDTAQHLNVARNILNGKGFVTTALYYEEQLQHGSVPAPQTVWPPGYPALIALLGAVGVDLATAANALLIAALFLNPLILFVIARLSGLGQFASACVSLLLVLFWPMAYGVLWYETEVLFVTVTLASLMALQVADLKNRSRSAWLLLAGVLGAGAVLIRYAGLCWIMALGAAVIWRVLVFRDMRCLREMLPTVVPGALVVIILLLRNRIVTGHLSGGASVRLDSSWGDLIRAVLGQWRVMFGIPGEGVLSDLGLLAVFGVVGIVFAVWIYRLLSSLWEGVLRISAWAVVSGIYVVFSVMLILYMAWHRHPDLIAFRYFVPVVPFILLMVGWVVVPAIKRIPRWTGRYAANAAVAFFVSMGLLGQAVAGSEWFERYRRAERSSIVPASMSWHIDGRTLQEYLEENAGSSGTILAPDAQLLGYLAGVPTISLPAPYYTSRIWTAEEIRNLVCRFNTKLVVFYPELFDENGPYDSNRVFFSELLTDTSVPAWLEVVHRTDDLHVYRIVDACTSAVQ